MCHYITTCRFYCESLIWITRLPSLTDPLLPYRETSRAHSCVSAWKLCLAHIKHREWPYCFFFSPGYDTCVSQDLVAIANTSFAKSRRLVIRIKDRWCSKLKDYNDEMCGLKCDWKIHSTRFISQKRNPFISSDI